jgi:hypothetical protein
MKKISPLGYTRWLKSTTKISVFFAAHRDVFIFYSWECHFLHCKNPHGTPPANGADVRFDDKDGLSCLVLFHPVSCGFRGKTATRFLAVVGFRGV